MTTAIKKLLIKIGVYALLALGAYLFIRDYTRTKNAYSILQANQEILLSEKAGLLAENNRYRVADSLNAIKAEELRLTAYEYQKYYAESLKLINKLKLDKRDMQRVIDMQANTISELSTNVRDTVIIRDTTRIPAKTFSYRSKWTDVDGLIDLADDTIDLSINNRESLIVVESVEYRRFLGFLWKTKNIKSRSVDIVSLNPNTVITNAEYKSIEKLK